MSFTHVIVTCLANSAAPLLPAPSAGPAAPVLTAYKNANKTQPKCLLSVISNEVQILNIRFQPSNIAYGACLCIAYAK